MKTRHINLIHSPLAWLAIAMLALSGSLPAQIIPGRYIAVLKAETRDIPGAAKALAAQHNLNVDHVYTKALKGFAFGGSEQAAQALARRAETAYVEPDQIYTAFQQTVPTGIRRSAAAAVPGLIGSGLMVDADVAVIDTGLDGTHPDLNVMPEGIRFYSVNANKMKSDSNWQDDNGHGTHVGGTIGALDNGIGVVGVAPGARLWAVKVLDSNGSCSLAMALAGVDWVVQRAATFEVANMSLGGSYSQAMNDAVKAGTQAGIVFVVAAGNSGWDAINYSPASEPTALTVSALDDNDGRPGGLGGWTEELEQDDWLAWFSNYGEIVDVCAPGVAIYSTYLMSNGGYTTMSGTSMSSPHAAGAAALYIARHGLTKTAAGVEAVCAAVRNSGWQDGHYAYFYDFIYYEERFDTSHEPLLNVADLLYWETPATLSFSAPDDASKVAGNAILQVATSAAGATTVKFYLDGELIGEDADGTDGWTINWDATTSPDGPRTLVAVATDGAEQLAGDAIVVGVNNAAGMVPVVFIYEPYWDPYYGGEAFVNGQITVSAFASDMVPVTGVEFYCGETCIGSGVRQATGEWSLTWDTTTVPDGIYDLVAAATAEDGSAGTSPPVPIEVGNRAIHIGDLDGVGLKVNNQGQWLANVWVTVHDPDHQPLAGATVAGKWAYRDSWTSWPVYSPATPLVTDANGMCQFTSDLVKKTSPYIQFMVTGVTPPPGWEDVPYRSWLNDDPDGDSNGYYISVFKP